MTALPYILFAVSGFAALLYEVVWTRRLVLVFGATVHSVSTVLAGFMAGFALGALWGSRLAKKAKDPWRLYGWLELGVALSAAVFPLEIRGILALAESRGLPHGSVRFLLTFAALLPPTILMGATFPVLTQHVARKDPARQTGNLYAANLLGACLGTLGGAFLFLAFLGLSGTHWLAVALNAAAGLAALLAPPGRHAAHPSHPPAASARAGIVAPAAVLVSGFCGMAFEVVWTRILVPSFNNSAYGFASVLFVFLAGLGAGSFLAGRFKAKDGSALGALLATSGLFGFVAFCTFEFAQLLEIRFGDFTNSGVRPILLLPLLEAAAVLGPVAVLQGMSLPVALRLAGGRDGAGTAAGQLYFWNTLGGIAGSLVAGFYLVPTFNVQNALMAVIAVSVLSGAAVLAWTLPSKALRLGAPALAALALAAGWGWLSGRHVPMELLTEWTARATRERPEVLFYTDDVEASVAALKRSGSRYLVINGVGVTGYTNATKLMAHIPLALHPAPERVLIICFGMGTTFRSALHHPVRVDAVDLVPSVLSAFPFFYPDALQWALHPRARRLVNDGRNHLLNDREGYDVVIVDPSPPLYAAGTVNLYSRDFFDLARRRLKPGGLLAVWIPEYPEPEFQMIMKSFIESAPHSQAWLATRQLGGLLLLGSDSPIPLDPARVRARLAEVGVRNDLLQFDKEFATEAAFWSLYLGPGERFRDYLRDVPEVTDDYPWIEYPYFRALKRSYFRQPEVLKWEPVKTG